MTYIITYSQKYGTDVPQTDFVHQSAMAEWMHKHKGDIVITLLKKIKSKHTMAQPQVPTAEEMENVN